MKAVRGSGCGNFSSRSPATEKHPRQRLCNHQKTFRAAPNTLRLKRQKRFRIVFEQRSRGARGCENVSKVQKIQNKNLRRWRSSRAGERITRAAAQGGVETFGAAVPGTLVHLYPGVETFWSRIEV